LITAKASLRADLVDTWSTTWW